MTPKKKLLIANNNMRIGGVQKALTAMLPLAALRYDITLLLFDARGELLGEVPENVKIVPVRGAFRLVGCSQRDCTTPGDRLIRGSLAAITKMFGFGAAVSLMELSCPGQTHEYYDAAISYLHCSAQHSFYGGTAEYVLDRVNAKKKLCFIHCDYTASGTRSGYSDGIYRRFDTIACVSDSVRARFAEALPELANRCVTVPNAIDAEKIKSLAAGAEKRENGRVELLTVARLSGEKGIDRVLRALATLERNNFHYTVVGDGEERNALVSLAESLSLSDRVTFTGEETNPYRRMASADLLVVPSRHEAAPVVFREALLLGLPVLSTATLSAREMLGENGFVTENTDSALTDMLRSLLDEPERIRKIKEHLADSRYEEPDTLSALNTALD